MHASKLTEPPKGHGYGATAYYKLGCICRWCDPYRWDRDFAGGGHQEWAEVQALDAAGVEAKESARDAGE